MENALNVSSTLRPVMMAKNVFKVYVMIGQSFCHQVTASSVEITQEDKEMVSCAVQMIVENLGNYCKMEHARAVKIITGQALMGRNVSSNVTQGKDYFQKLNVFLQRSLPEVCPFRR